MSELHPYIGVKLVDARPEERDGVPGYFITYPDGYESWSPAATFEAAYLPLDAEDPTRVTNNVLAGIFDGRAEFQRLGNHAVICAPLRTGFSIVEDAACVDPENFDEDLGVTLAVEKAKRIVQGHMGFVLAWARNGLTSERAET